MRTTVTIDDALLDQVRRRAAERGRTVSDVIDDALRMQLATTSPRPKPRPVAIFGGGTGPAPGVDVTSNAAMAVAVDEGVAVDKRR